MRLYLAALLTLILPAHAAALICRVEGSIADAAGKPLTGTFLLDFKLREGGRSGAEVWTESQYIRAEKGAYQASLGGIRDIPEDSLDAAYLSAEAPAASGWRVGELVLLAVSAPKPPPAAAVTPPAANAIPDGAGDARPPASTAPPAPVLPPAPIKREPPPPVAPVPAAVKKATPVEPPAPAKIQRRAEKILPNKLEAAEPEPERPASYEVQAGDTLPAIALKLYGSPKRWKDLYRANESKLGRGGAVTPGQTLVVPE